MELQLGHSVNRRRRRWHSPRRRRTKSPVSFAQNASAHRRIQSLPPKEQKANHRKLP